MWTERPVRLLGLVAAGVLLSGVAACGGDTGGEEQLDISGSGDETTPGTADPPDSSSASTPPAGAPEVRPAPEKGKTVPDEYGTWVLSLPEKRTKRLVGQAFADYMEVRIRSYHTGKVDLTELSSVALGSALTQVQAAVTDLKQDGLHTVGDAWTEIAGEDVRVNGGQATLSGVCLHNATVDVNADDVAQESPPDAYRVDATAARVAKGTWLISEITFDDASSC